MIPLVKTDYSARRTEFIGVRLDETTLISLSKLTAELNSSISSVVYDIIKNYIIYHNSLKNSAPATDKSTVTSNKE